MCRRVGLPLSYTAIAVGGVWTVATAPALLAEADAHDIGSLRLGSSILIGGLLLAALVHWGDEACRGGPNKTGDESDSTF